MKTSTVCRVSIAPLACAFIFATIAYGRENTDATPRYVDKVPHGYRDWKLISVAREDAPLDDVRAILGNDVAIKAYRERKLPFPDGSVIARLAWEYTSSDENNAAFGRTQSHVAGQVKNGIQFMVKDTKKYAATGGWGYGHFEQGKSADETMLRTCFPCHQAIKGRDFVFTQYAQ